MKVKYCQSDFVSPRRVLLQSNAVPGPAEQVAGRDEVAVARGLELQAGAVPDECVQMTEERERRRESNNDCYNFNKIDQSSEAST